MDESANGFVTEAELLEGARKVVEVAGRKYLIRRLRSSRVIGILGNIPDLFAAMQEKEPATRRKRITEAVSKVDPAGQVEKMEAVVVAALVKPKLGDGKDGGPTIDDLPSDAFKPLWNAIWEFAGMGKALSEAKEELDPTSATGSSASSSTESPVATAADQAT